MPKTKMQHQCSYGGCTAKFTRSTNLRRHEDGHKEVVKYTCGNCKKTFKREDNKNQFDGNSLKSGHLRMLLTPIDKQAYKAGNHASST